MYTLRLYHDTISFVAKPYDLEAQHSILYVQKGSVVINERNAKYDEALYCRDVAKVKPTTEGTVIWRWELVRTDAANNLAKGEGIESHLVMSRRVRMFELAPHTKWVFRLDMIFNNEGSTGLHSHPGSGIRCLVSGNLHVRGRVGEESDNTKQGDAWYEEGSYPIISTTDDGDTSAFLRGIILPYEYSQFPDTAVWIEGAKSVKSDWKLFTQMIITLI